MSGNLTFRLFQPDDITGVLRLWEESSGWGGITEEKFYKWYVQTPCGESLLAVTVDEANRVVGQAAFTPSRIYIEGAEKKALRFSAPILAKEFSKRLGAGHPTVEMFRVAMKAAIESGYSVVYALPARAWLRFGNFFVLPETGRNQCITAKLNCYGISLKTSLSEVLVAEKAVKVSLAAEFNNDYDDLWELAKINFPMDCTIVRDSKWLRWKLGGHHVLEVRRDGKELIGYAAIKKDSGLLMDAVALTPNDLEVTIKAIINALRDPNFLQSRINLDEIKFMDTAAIAPIARNLGFSRINFQFGFYCYSLDDTVAMQSLEPSRWYLMPND